jgi:hypothetical protein
VLCLGLVFVPSLPLRGSSGLNMLTFPAATLELLTHSHFLLSWLFFLDRENQEASPGTSGRNWGPGGSCSLGGSSPSSPSISQGETLPAPATFPGSVYFPSWGHLCWGPVGPFAENPGSLSPESLCWYRNSSGQVTGQCLSGE